MKKKIFIVILLLIALVPIMNVGAIEMDTAEATLKVQRFTRVSCGGIEDIPRKIPELTSMFVTIIQIAIPIVLIILGSIDLLKGVMAQKEDEIKKGQKIFVKRLVVAAIIFFVVVIVRLLISLVSDDSNNILDCVDCFISSKCSEYVPKKKA